MSGFFFGQKIGAAKVGASRKTVDDVFAPPFFSHVRLSSFRDDAHRNAVLFFEDVTPRWCRRAAAAAATNARRVIFLGGVDG